jgi:hypothetical protein
MLLVLAVWSLPRQQARLRQSAGKQRSHALAGFDRGHLIRRLKQSTTQGPGAGGEIEGDAHRWGSSPSTTTRGGVGR